MVRGVIVLITAGLAYLILKKKQYRHHLLSLFLILIGEVLVGIAAITMTGSSEETGIEGIIMLLVAKVLTGFHFIVEEKLLGKYILHPLKVVGLEGMFGCIYFVILLPIF
jgi:drug/metabolite transporter (DMT)-like permease